MTIQDSIYIINKHLPNINKDICFNKQDLKVFIGGDQCGVSIFYDISFNYKHCKISIQQSNYDESEFGETSDHMFETPYKLRDFIRELPFYKINDSFIFMNIFDYSIDYYFEDHVKFLCQFIKEK